MTKRMYEVITKSVACGAIIVLSFAMSISYSLGPDTRAVSMDEFNAMEYVWYVEKESLATPPCVIADTFPLLALEGISSKYIIGGGFPINQYFAQPEREALLQEMLKNPREEIWRQALDITKTNTCWLVVHTKDFHSNSFFNQHQLDVVEFGSVLAWKYSAPSESIKIK
jgi:hypothetical protein